MEKEGNTTEKLQHTQLTIQNQTLCNEKYDTDNFDELLELQQVVPELIQPNLICASSEVCNNQLELFSIWKNKLRK